MLRGQILDLESRTQVPLNPQVTTQRAADQENTEHSSEPPIQV